MSVLAIKGHATRGSEVIEILEMLGGRNLLLQQGCGKGIYLIDTSKHTIIYIYEKDIIDKFIVFTLEEFLEEYPYKVGDKIDLNGDEVDITGLYWNGTANAINYEGISVKLEREYDCISVKDMKPYTEQKDESMEEKSNNWAKWDLPEGYEFQDGNGNVINATKIMLVKKQTQYPKTYEECCKVLGVHTSNGLLHDDSRVILAYKIRLVACLQELLICRDAYWKIAGNWKPNYDDDEQDKWGILKLDSNDYQYGESTSFVFSTEEMRDAFYENFKELIEQCKELL